MELGQTRLWVASTEITQQRQINCHILSLVGIFKMYGNHKPITYSLNAIFITFIATKQILVSVENKFEFRRYKFYVNSPAAIYSWTGYGSSLIIFDKQASITRYSHLDSFRVRCKFKPPLGSDATNLRQKQRDDLDA